MLKFNDSARTMTPNWPIKLNILVAESAAELKIGETISLLVSVKC